MIRIANTTLGGVILSDSDKAVIIENVAKKEAFLAPLPLYTRNSDLTDVFDFGGTLKSITLRLKYMGDDLSDVKAQIDSIEATIQGQQDLSKGYPLAFEDDLRGSLKVKVVDFESVVVSGEFIMLGTLKLMESNPDSG